MCCLYTGSSVHQNGCYADVKGAVSAGNGTFFELSNASRELKDIERGLELVKQHGIELVIGAGGASIMDCAKLIAFGAFHGEDLWDYVKGRKDPYGEKKEENYAYDIYEAEFIPEVLFGSTYRKSLTTLFPAFLKTMAVYHREDIQNYFKDAFGYDGEISQSADCMRELFEQIGVDMHFDGELSKEAVSQVSTGSCLSQDELYEMLKECMR